MLIFALKRYLGLSEEEMARNAELWAEENNVPQKRKSKTGELRAGGVTQSGISTDLDQFEEPTAEPGAPDPAGTQPGQPGTTPGGQGGGGTTPGGTGGGGQV